MLAPPWIPVPPPAYGGIEEVVALLCEGLVARGHEVTLFAAPGSVSSAQVCSPLERSYPGAMGQALHDADHVASVFDRIDLAERTASPFDVVHDHSGLTALAMANRLSTPMVHTLHGAFTDQTSPAYVRHGHKATLVAISDSQLEDVPSSVSVACEVPNPIAVEDWAFRQEKDGFVLWIGRLTDVKGPHRAIRAARLAGKRLVLAGPVQPGQEAFFESEVEPHIDGHQVCYLGEVGGQAKARLLAAAGAVLMPIRWREPFGMVMVEALACGTPVIAFPEGAAREIVIHGVNGFLVENESEMAEAIQGVQAISPAQCRASVLRYDVRSVAARYEAVYQGLVRARANGHPRTPGLLARGGPAHPGRDHSRTDSSEALEHAFPCS